MRTLTLTALATIAALCAGCTAAEDLPAPADGPLPAHTTQVTFSVEGMSCEACPPQVRKKVASLEGIDPADVDVDLEAATCTVRVQEGDPSAEAIAKTVEGSQFTLAPTK